MIIANFYWELTICQALFWMLILIVSFTFHNKPFYIDAVLQKSSEGVMAQGDPRREEESQTSDAGSLAPESGSDHHTLHLFCLNLGAY